jgi:hypothetical protein
MSIFALLPKKKLRHLYPVTSFLSSLWQPGDPPSADPWLSVTRLLGFWLFRAQILINVFDSEYGIKRPQKTGLKRKIQYNVKIQ